MHQINGDTFSKKPTSLRYSFIYHFRLTYDSLTTYLTRLVVVAFCTVHSSRAFSNKKDEVHRYRLAIYNFAYTERRAPENLSSYHLGSLNTLRQLRSI